MAFFCLLVLALISMGGGEAATAATRPDATQQIVVRPSTDAGAAQRPTASGTVLLFFRGRFFNPDMSAAAPSALSTGGEIIVAIDPSLTAGEAIAVRTQVPGSNVVLTTLTPDWIARLKAGAP